MDEGVEEREEEVGRAKERDMNAEGLEEREGKKGGWCG